MKSGFVIKYLCILQVVMLYLSFISSTEITEKTPALSQVEKYRDLFPLIDGNFTEKLLKNKDAWIVIFHNGSVDMQWKTMATHLRGICWVGLVDITKEMKLIEQLEINVENEVARVYPFGNKGIKQRQWRTVKDQNEARQTAVDSLPDTTLQLRAEELEHFLQEALLSNPSRFPVYYITDEQETPGLLKAVSLRFKKYFLFGRVSRPTSDDLRRLGLENKYITKPSLYVIVFRDGAIDKINAIEFIETKNGQMNYTNIMQFLFGINSEFRYQLPGNNQANVKQAANMEDIIKVEKGRFSFLLPGVGYQNTVVDQKSEREQGENPGHSFTNHLKDEL